MNFNIMQERAYKTKNGLNIIIRLDDEYRDLRSKSFVRKPKKNALS